MGRIADLRRQYKAELIAGNAAPPAHRIAPAMSPASAVTQPARCAIPLHCSLYGNKSLILAEQHSDKLKLLQSVKMPDGLEFSSPEQTHDFMETSGVATLPPTIRLGTFKIDAASWGGCPHCGAKDSQAHNVYSIWFCNCDRCKGLWHCAGNRNGMFRKACGGFTNLASLDLVDTVQVQGWQGFAAHPTTLRRPPPMSITTPHDRQLHAPPSSSLRIGYGGKR